jgi:predicted TIM-barrel fold metal-dependent hydrolase
MRRPPPLSCDCHIHVFGPSARYPLDPGAKYTPDEALLADYLKVAAALGTGRVVLVQPSVYGVDNACQRDAIEELGERARGVAVIDDSVDDDALGALCGAGFVGARLNLLRADSLDALERVAARVQPLGWHLQLHLSGHWLPEMAERLLKLPVEFVIDHFGRIDAREGADQPAFKALLRLVDAGKCWVKLSAPYRADLDGAPWRKVAPLAQALVRHAPERMVWGTNWPHPDVTVVPEDQGLFDALAAWVPDEATRHRILVENPAKLYRF